MGERCHLCRTEARLCRSHIIPEYCFKNLYDEKHHFIEMYDVRQERIRLGQKGWSEPILCSACEALFARYERHCRRLFADPLPPIRPGTKRVLDIPRLDVARLRYFFLSILWRANEARSAVFKHVDLGPKHSEELRSSLLSERLPDFDRYGCFVLSLHYEDAPMSGIIVEPTYTRIDGHKVYRFVFTGLVVHMFVSSHPLPDSMRRTLLGAAAGVVIYKADLPEIGFLRRLWFKC